MSITVQFAARIPKDQLDKLRQTAAKQGVSVGSLIAMAVYDYNEMMEVKREAIKRTLKERLEELGEQRIRGKAS